MGEPTISYDTAGIALRVIWLGKSDHNVKVSIPSGRTLEVYRRKFEARTYRTEVQISIM